MRVLLGLLFTTVAVIFLLFSIAPAVLEDSQAVLDVLERIYCEPGDQLSAKQIITHDSEGTGYSADYTCTTRNEDSYNVTEKSFIITAVGFTIPLLLGIGFFIAAGSNATRNVTTTTFDTYSGLIQPNTSGSGVVIGGGSANLTAKLQELKKAYDQNLITADEYERKRQDVLNQFK